MLDPPLAIPEPVLNWLRGVFSEVNRRSSAKLSRNANVWETSLDMTVIEQLSQFTAPFKFPSQWIVRLETHYLGGGRYWGRWEIADLGVLIVFRKRGKVLGTKVALLQSKRLYPEELEASGEDHELDYRIGFGRLLESDSEYQSLVRPRTFHFSDKSRYRALEYDGEQYNAILKYIKDTGNRLSKILVVCPKLLIPQWREELETKFGIPGIEATGNELLAARVPEGGGAVITTYQSARMYLPVLSQSGFEMLILDEAHKLRNLYGANQSPQVALRFREALANRMFKYVLMLTATPIQNRLWDIYSLVDLLAVARGHQNPLDLQR